jgi:hypothetical protein
MFTPLRSGYPKKLQAAIDAHARELSAKWFKRNVTMGMRDFCEENSVRFLPTGLGYHSLNHGYALSDTVSQFEAKWRLSARYLRDALRSLLYNFRHAQLTMTEVVVMMSVAAHGVFFSKDLTTDFIEKLAGLAVVHADTQNTWSSVLWDWSEFCAQYNGGERFLCVEMTAVFRDALAAIFECIESDPAYFESDHGEHGQGEHGQGEHGQEEQSDPERGKVPSACDAEEPADVQPTEFQFAHVLLGMRTPSQITGGQKTPLYYTLKIVTGFMAMDFGPLRSLVVQSSLCCRAAESAQDQCLPLTKHALDRDYSGLKIERVWPALLDSNLRQEVFVYPSFMTPRGPYVECLVSFADHRVPVCLPVVVCAYLSAESAETMGALKKICKGSAGTEDFFKDVPVDQTTTCLGARVPESWARVLDL